MYSAHSVTNKKAILKKLLIKQHLHNNQISAPVHWLMVYNHHLPKGLTYLLTC